MTELATKLSRSLQVEDKKKKKLWIFQACERKRFWENTGSEEAGDGGVLLRSQGGCEGARQESQAEEGQGRWGVLLREGEVG